MEEDENKTKVKLRISGMTCTSCVQSIDSALKKIDGIDFTGINLVDKTAIIKYDANKLDVDEIKQTIKDTGYEAIEDDPKITKMPNLDINIGENTAIDPVCGMTVDKKTAIKRIIG
ncbi:MAG: cation transporter, partial [Promethearchaeota archaeon]